MSARTRVLVVDDDFEFRNAIAEALGHLGWEVRGAATGGDALGLLRSWPPDVILLDLVLPAMDGWAFRAEADRQNALQGVPIIVTSGDPNVRLEAENSKPPRRSRSHLSWTTSFTSSNVYGTIRIGTASASGPKTSVSAACRILLAGTACHCHK